jgi:phage shock protein PspC (stress-responsive transcriptional regulator)
MSDSTDSGATNAGPQAPYGAPPPPPPPPPPPGPSGTGGASRSADNRRSLVKVFDPIRGMGLVRSEHRVVGGVCGGVAERTGIDPTVIRVVAVVLAVFGGLGVLLYGLGWLLLPEPDGRIHADEVLHGRVEAGAVGAIVLTVLSLGGGGGWSRFGWGVGWHHGLVGFLWSLTGTAVALAAIVLVVYAVVHGRSRRAGSPPPAAPPTAGPSPEHPGSPGVAPAAGPAEAYSGSSATTTLLAPPAAPPADAPAPAPAAPEAKRPRRESLGGYGAVIGGLALLGAGVTVLVTRSGDYQISTAAQAWSVALAVIALVLVVGGVMGRRSGIVTLFALVALVGTLTASVVPKASHTQGIGQRLWQPTTVTRPDNGFALGIGHGTLDLTGLDRSALSSAGPQHVPVSVGIGQLTVLVPSGLTVVVHTTASVGSLPAPFGDAISITDETRDNDGAFNGRDPDGDLGGVGIKRTVTVGTGAPELVVNAKVGFGEVEVREVTP